MAGTGNIARHWQALRDSGELQFAPLPPEPPPAPPSPWWQWLGRTLGQAFEWIGRLLRPLFEPLGHALGVSWPVMRVALAVIAVLLVMALLWRLWRGRRRQAARESATGWQPDTTAARELLADADALAADGRYDEAVHVLLARSVARIEQQKPGLLKPASTAREIAATLALPSAARLAFATIAQRVEASRFALRALAEADWLAARKAYAEFALGGEP